MHNGGLPHIQGKVKKNKKKQNMCGCRAARRQQVRLPCSKKTAGAATVQQEIRLQYILKTAGTGAVQQEVRLQYILKTAGTGAVQQEV